MKTHYIEKGGSYRFCDGKAITKEDVKNLTNTKMMVTCKKCKKKLNL